MNKPHRTELAGRLRAFHGMVFVDDEAHLHRGRWRDLFRGRLGDRFGGRIIFEIGCSDADFLARIAMKHPQVGFIGLDWKYKSLHAGAERIVQSGLSNVILLRGRAQDIGAIFAAGELDEVWLFHPDPCDKPRELRNRLISERFLLDVHPVLKPASSRLCLKTDHVGYYQWVLALLGLPAPPHLASARDGSPGSAASAPRVRKRDLMAPIDLPPASAIVRAKFGVAANTPDFWNDRSTLHHTRERFFANEKTCFEDRFVRKRLPIYYIELARGDLAGDSAEA